MSGREPAMSNDTFSKAPSPRARLPWVGAGISLLRDPTAYLERCRKKHGDTFAVRAFGTRILFVFSPQGVKNLWALPEAQASKGLADFAMLRHKVPDELFAGRRTRPHDLFSRDDVAAYLRNVHDAVEAQLDELGSSGEVELFALTKRFSHRAGLASWGGLTGPSIRHLDALADALDRLDSSESFVRPARALLTVLTQKRAERRALVQLEEIYRDIIASRSAQPLCEPDLFDRICATWANETRAKREMGIARDVVLVHMGSQSNLFAANAWTLVHLLERPELLEAVRDGDLELLERCTHESIRLRQRSIVLRRALRGTELCDEKARYFIDAGHFLATTMAITNPSAAQGLDTFDPDHFDGARFTRRGELPARELVSTFGHGRHSCPAMNFSIASIRAFVSGFLERFDLEARFRDPQPLRRQIGGVARADRPCRVRYSLRESSR